jgi:ribonucleoside-diphosphate reductase alpha subunit
MFVIKRSGNKEPVHFDKITSRIRKLLTDGLESDIDPVVITQNICSKIYSGISTIELDNLASQICMSMVTDHPSFGILASKIAISNHQKNTPSNFYEVLQQLNENKDILQQHSPIIAKDLFDLVEQNQEIIQNMIDLDRDYLLDYFGFKTLERSYLLRINDPSSPSKKKIIERPQHLFMRVALAIHKDNFEKVKKVYDNLSLKHYTHATPTLFNSGLNRQQLLSCFLTTMEDSIEGIFETYTECGLISKWAGGIGCDISKIRSKGAYIRKTGGLSDGIMPLLKTFNSIARQFNQGGKRLGSFAVYLPPWHDDIFTFLEAKKNHGADEERARDLFYGLWISDYFMECVEKDTDWYLMNPDESVGLMDVYGDEFRSLYIKYVQENKFVRKIKARDVWKAIISAQVEQGVPYMCYKDAANIKSNQKNIGVIKSSNLCSEIMEVATKDEIACCNLASIVLPTILEKPDRNEFIQTLKWYKLLNEKEKSMYKYYFESDLKLYSKDDCNYCKLLKGLLKRINLPYEEINETEAEMLRLKSNPTSSSIVKPFETVPQLFGIYRSNDIEHLGGYTNVWEYLKPRIDYNRLKEYSYELTENLNEVIDNNYYPVNKTKKSNLAHRNIGIGVQGLADLFLQLKLSFDSEEAREINKKLFETIYYGALTSSINLAKIHKRTYDTYEGSPLSQGILNFELWGKTINDLSGMWDWNDVKLQLKEFGCYNSLLVALMPTASTSQIMGSYVEAFEALSSNLYTRRTLAGEFTVINPYLVKDLIDLGIYNEECKARLIYDKGSVQKFKNLPKFLKDIYRTVYEISQKNLITMSAQRAIFVCQSQSLNLFFETPDFNKLTSAHFHGWKLGLKTGSYYIRSKAVKSAQRFGLSVEYEKKFNEEDTKLDEDEGCVNCSA